MTKPKTRNKFGIKEFTSLAEIKAAEKLLKAEWDDICESAEMIERSVGFYDEKMTEINDKIDEFEATERDEEDSDVQRVIAEAQALLNRGSQEENIMNQFSKRLLTYEYNINKFKRLKAQFLNEKKNRKK